METKTLETFHSIGNLNMSDFEVPNLQWFENDVVVCQIIIKLVSRPRL
jgi:hypothetical protein